MSNKLKKKNTRVKVMLMESVNRYSAGSIISAKPGYARYLVSSKKGIFEKGNEEFINSRIQEWQKTDEARVSNAKQEEERLKSIELVLYRKSGFSGLLYGSVTAKDIAKELEAHDCKIKRSDIVMEQIRHTGKYNILINLYGGTKATIEVTVNNDAN